MALTATAAFQFVSSTDLDVYTTGSQTPTSGDLYVAICVGRTGDDAARVPTVTGTNGWNVTWTRAPAAQAIYAFSGIDRCSIEVFWGVASSGTAGTVTFDYGAGTNLKVGALHMIEIGGGPDTSAPIGVTGSNHNDTGSASISATLTGTPASTSVMVACGTIDRAPSTASAGTNYTLFGTEQDGDTGGSAIEKDETPNSTTVAMSWDVGDICAISAVEVIVASAPPWEPETNADETIRVLTGSRW